MTAEEFIVQTKELIPDKEKISISLKSEPLIIEILTSFLISKNNIIYEENPIFWIVKNCFIEKFRIGHIYFIENFTIERFTIFAQSEADYLGIDLTTNEIYLIGYEMIDEYLYGDGDIPDFINIYPIAQDAFKFLDALAEKLQAKKLIFESSGENINEIVNMISQQFKNRATQLAGGGKYEFWRIF